MTTKRAYCNTCLGYNNNNNNTDFPAAAVAPSLYAIERNNNISIITSGRHRSTK